MADLSKLVSQVETQAKDIRNVSAQGNGGQNTKRTEEVILRGSVPSWYDYNGNGIGIRSGSYMNEGTDMTDGINGSAIPLNKGTDIGNQK